MAGAGAARWKPSQRTVLVMDKRKGNRHVQNGLEPNGSDLYSEFMGFDDQIYSLFHCDLYTITIVQDPNGTIVGMSYETDDEPVQEL